MLFAVGDHVRIKATKDIGTVAAENGHACKIGRRWYHAEDVEMVTEAAGSYDTASNSSKDALGDQTKGSRGSRAEEKKTGFERHVANTERLLRLWLRGLSCKTLGHTAGENDEAFVEFMLGEGPCFGELYDVDAQTVGSGGFGLPHLGSHRGQPCVIKIEDKEVAGDEYRQNLVEAGLFEVLLKMSQEQEHANIVSYVDCLEGPLNYYVVMEQLQGSDLFDQFLYDHPVTESYICDIMRQVLLALQHVHDVVGLVHRDVKFANFRYEEPSANSKLKLLDFGFARKKDAAWEERISGTLPYLAPEIVTDAQTVESRGLATSSDVWAAGVMLYVFMCGKEPFKEHEVWELGRAGGPNLIAKCMRNMSLKHWSNEAQDILRKLLTLDPASRVTAAQALEHPWFTGGQLLSVVSPVARHTYHLAGESSRLATVLRQQTLDSVASLSPCASPRSPGPTPGRKRGEFAPQRVRLGTAPLLIASHRSQAAAAAYGPQSPKLKKREISSMSLASEDWDDGLFHIE